MDKVLPDMIRNDLKDLHAQLKALGFRERLVGAVKFYIDYPQQSFTLLDRYRTEFEKIHYTLHFERNQKGSYDFKSYDTMLRILPAVPSITIKGIDASHLDTLMKKFDWTIDQHTMEIVNERMQTKNSREELKELETIMNGINKLYNTISGRDSAEKLMFKYWMDTPYEPNTLSLEHVRLRHEFKTSVTVDGPTGLTALQSYDMLKSTAAAHTKKTSVLSDEVLDKAETAIRNGNSWMAYNNSLYFIETSDMQFFRSKESANEFAFNNHSDHDHFNVTHISSVRDLFEKIPYGADLNHHPQLLKENKLYNLKTNVMNEQNLDYLKGNIKLTGFGENFDAELEKHLKEGKDEFHLTYKAEINKKPFEASLNFRKSEKTDMYFFNSYHASLQKNNGEKVDQTFYLNNGKGITAKESFNMLDGRSVHKELTNKDGVQYKAWLQLDFENKDKNNNFEVKQFHENYGYDLKASVSKYAVAELKDPEKEKSLMQSLQRGNVQSVSIEKDGSTQKMFIEANPQYKTLNLYDGQMKRVQKENVEQYMAEKQTNGKEVKQGEKEGLKATNNNQGIKPQEKKIKRARQKVG